MSNEQAFRAVLDVLQSGGWIEQVQSAPLQYRLYQAHESVCLPGHYVQRLLASERIQVVCKVSGRLRYVMS